MSTLAEKVWRMIHGPNAGPPIDELVELIDSDRAELSSVSFNRAIEAGRNFNAKTFHGQTIPDVGEAIASIAPDPHWLEAHDADLLKAKELGVIQHVNGGWDDACMCEPCVFVRELVADKVNRAVLAESQAILALLSEYTMSRVHNILPWIKEIVAANRRAAASGEAK